MYKIEFEEEYGEYINKCIQELVDSCNLPIPIYEMLLPDGVEGYIIDDIDDRKQKDSQVIKSHTIDKEGSIMEVLIEIIDNRERNDG